MGKQGDARDSQKKRLYEAENRIRDILDSGVQTADFHGSTLVMPCETKFGSLESVEAYLRWIALTPWYRKHYGQPMPAVRRRRGNAHAHYEPGFIALSDTNRASEVWALRELVVLHELAHHLTPTDPGHGPQFAGVFQHLVREVFSPELGLLLGAAFDASGVKWNYVNELETSK